MEQNWHQRQILEQRLLRKAQENWLAPFHRGKS